MVAENLTGNVTGALRYVLYILFCSKSMLISQKNIKLKGRPDGRPNAVEKVANRHLGEIPSRG